MQCLNTSVLHTLSGFLLVYGGTTMLMADILGIFVAVVAITNYQKMPGLSAMEIYFLSYGDRCVSLFDHLSSYMWYFSSYPYIVTMAKQLSAPPPLKDSNPFHDDCILMIFFSNQKACSLILSY